MQPEVHDNFNEWVSNLRELGVKVISRRIETFWEAKKLIAEQGWLGAIEAWDYHKELLTGPRKGELDQRVQQRMSAAGDLPASVVNTIRTRRPQLIAAIAEELNGALFAMPTVKHVAPELAPLEKDVNLFASTNRATNDYTMVASYLNVPGIAMPNGVGEMGLPVSVLLSGASGSDDTVLNTALTLEKALSKFNYI
jgi:aspartyl-tRNA(Asn)/glutamyl-tRNA(Gln) amidotransferase subunit A